MYQDFYHYHWTQHS